MAQVILNNRVNMNEVFSVQRDLDNYETFARRAEAKLVEFKALEQALLHGSKDLGNQTSAFDGSLRSALPKGWENRDPGSAISDRFCAI